MMNANCVAITLSNEELGAVLAGLRTLQEMMIEQPDGVRFKFAFSEIMTDGGSIEPLTVEEIDELCQKINTSTIT